MPDLSGTLIGAGSDASARVIAVGDRGDVLSETHAGKDGSWTLRTGHPVAWVVASLTGSRIAAVAAEPGNTHVLQFPPLVDVQFAFSEPPTGALVWIDPVQIEGFPSELLPALRLHANRTLDIHLGELPATGTQRFPVQRGSYRISGGVMAFSPQPTSSAFVLDTVVDEASGATLRGVGGEVVAVVTAGVRYRVGFAPA